MRIATTHEVTQEVTYQPVVFDLVDYDSSSAEGLDDGRIRIDLSSDVVLIGTAAELLDLGAAITSHTRGIMVEQERAGKREQAPAA